MCCKKSRNWFWIVLGILVAITIIFFIARHFKKLVEKQAQPLMYPKPKKNGKVDGAEEMFV